MIRTRRHAALAALAVLCMAVAGFSSASFGAGSANPGNAFSAAADWVAPVVALTSPADGGSTNTTPTFSGTAGTAAGDLSTVTVKVYSGSSATGSPIQTLTTTQSGGAWSVPASPALAEGTYTARAQQSDSSGNIGTSASSTFVIDRTAPAGLTLTAPLNGSATNNTTPTFSGVAGNAATDSATVTVKVYSGSDTSGTLVQTRSATRSGSSWSISATTLAQGTYTAQAQQSDTAGNSSSSSTTTFKVDTTAPTVPSSVIAATSAGVPLGNPGFIRQGGKYRVYANASDSLSGVASVTASVSTITTGQTAVALTFDSTGVTIGATTYHYISAELTADATLSGTKSHTVTATDNAANSSGAVSFTNSATIDNTAPTSSLSTVSTPMRGTVTLNASGTDAGAGVAYITIQRAPNGTSTWTDICSDTTSPYSCSFDTTGVADGLYDFRAVTVDNAGNSTNSSSQTSKRVDNTQPTISSFTVPASNLSGTATLSASVSDAGSGVASVLMQRAPTGTSTWTDICTDTVTPYSCTFDTTAVSDGDYDFRATVTDAAGNATTSSTVTRHVDNPPVAVDVQAVNGGTTANRPDSGDVVTYTFSEPIAPASILAGWNGTTKTNITVKVVDGGNNDTLEVYSGATQLNTGTHDLKADFISTGTASLASSSIQMNGSSLIVTLGGTASFSGGGAWNSAPGAKGMQWTASSSAKDLAGNSAVTTKITEQGGSDADF